jgi:hypothetical protein
MKSPEIEPNLLSLASRKLMVFLCLRDIIRKGTITIFVEGDWTDDTCRNTSIIEHSSR